MASNGSWGEVAQHDDELGEAWDSYDPLPDAGINAALDAFCASKNLDIPALLRLGTRLASGTTLAFSYPGGVKFRDVETGRRWSYFGSQFHALKIVRAGAKTADTVIVAEGETDAARLSMVYGDCDVAVLPAGAKRFTQPFADQLKPYARVLIGLDDDAAGNEGATKIVGLLPHAVRFLPPANDWCAVREDFPTPPDVPQGPRGKFAGTRASSVKPLAIEWLWRPWIPRGALTLIYGEEGIGKGATAAYIAAQVTRGGLDAPPADVEWVTFEDDPDTVLVPRLIAAGAHLERVHFHAESDRFDSPLVLPDDLVAIGEAMRQRGSKLLVVDPLPDALRDGLKDNNNADVRTALRPLQQMAKQERVAVLGVAHPNKGAATAANKVMGSKAFRSVPRSVILFSGDPDDPQGSTRIMCLSKSNVSGTKPSVKVRIDSVQVPDVGDAPRVVIGEPSEYSDSDLVAYAATGKPGGGAAVTQAERAETLILDMLATAGGSVEPAKVYAAGETVGISAATLRRVRASLGLTSGKLWTTSEHPEI